MDILNYVKIDERIGTSGQPHAGQFELIARQGFRNVINLATATSDNAIPGEGGIVAGLGMNYLHLPVSWETPTAEHFDRFARLMDALRAETVWVHCALNWRVSCFMYLYQTLRGELDEPAARARMLRTWNPDDYPAWQVLIAEVRRKPVP
jgi:protein tyrosine phosphatase (PTP) superfamily phosphohydrolase (DUF442 family)